MKLFYFHVPKTAGTSINKFFETNTTKSRFHIEGVRELNKDFFDNHAFLSGHVSVNRINGLKSLINLKEWITFITFREPVSYVISHLKWVRKLADPGEEARFLSHPPLFQEISLKMKEFDFSNASEITEFIKWLDSINFTYFHNTQAHYLNSSKKGKYLTDEELNQGLKSLYKIDFVGIQEKLDQFMTMISYEFGWIYENQPKENINQNNYGFDINNPEIRKALKPLYEQDIIVYNEAKKIFSLQESLYLKTENKSILGYIDKVTEKKISGWVKFKDSLKKVELELRVKGIVIQTTTANIMRMALKSKGIHPTGLICFEFNLKEELDMNIFQVCVKDTKHILPFTQNLLI